MFRVFTPASLPWTVVGAQPHPRSMFYNGVQISGTLPKNSSKVGTVWLLWNQSKILIENLSDSFKFSHVRIQFGATEGEFFVSLLTGGESYLKDLKPKSPFLSTKPNSGLLYCSLASYFKWQCRCKDTVCTKLLSPTQASSIGSFPSSYWEIKLVYCTVFYRVFSSLTLFESVNA